MKVYKNYLLSVSAAITLLSSIVFSVPHPAHGHDIKSIGQTKLAADVQPSNTHVPVEPLRARVKLASLILQDSVSDTSDDLSIEASLGDENIALERKKHRRPGSCCRVVISIIAVLVGKPADGGPPMIDLRATITGTDAVRGSILYGLAWLAGDADSLGSVRALGYDIDVSKEHERPCANGPANRACVERARRLATLLDATLALDNPDERLSFRQGTAALGVAPDCVAGATQITSSLASASSPGVSVDLSIDASLGDQQIALEKAGRGDGDKYITIKLKDIIVTRQSAHPETIDLNVTITGEDRGPGSLLYALAWLGGATDPLGAVRALGYDVAVANPHVHSCPNRLQSHTCEDAARNLATLMDAALGLGDPAQRAQFRRDASAIGVAPDCSARTSVNN